MEVVLYSTHCPKCNILEKKLTQKGIDFTIVDDNAEVVKFGKAHKIMSSPILKVNGAVFDFNNANAWVNDLKDPTPETNEVKHTRTLNGEPIDCEEECKF
ncbi:MAG: hypothetical protein IJH34_09895 [Romboutsia sp.]|nr:hypothetical protein [Romboutsia sp.]